MASHFLLKFIGDRKGESIGRVCEEFHKPESARKMPTQEFVRKAAEQPESTVVSIGRMLLGNAGKA
jgi:hypothetical protein